jgi:hypothetical protein
MPSRRRPGPHGVRIGLAERLVDGRPRAVRGVRPQVRVGVQRLGRDRRDGNPLQRPAGVTSLPTESATDVRALGARIAVLPIGSFEQHGDHLPLATDSLIAMLIAAEISAASASYSCRRSRSAARTSTPVLARLSACVPALSTRSSETLQTHSTARGCDSWS